MFRIETYIGELPYRYTKGMVSSTPIVILPADPARAYVALYNGTGSQLFVGWDGNITGNSGPIVLNNFGQFELWWERHAVLCTLPLYGAISGAPAPYWTMEVFWRPVASIQGE